MEFEHNDILRLAQNGARGDTDIIEHEHIEGLRHGHFET